MVKIGKDGKIPGLNDNEDVMKIKTWTMWTTTGMGKTGIKNEAEQHHFIPPTLEKNPEWKLMILANEWNIESSYCSEDVAGLYGLWQPMHGPFLLVPSLQFVGGE